MWHVLYRIKYIHDQGEKHRKQKYLYIYQKPKIYIKTQKKSNTAKSKGYSVSESDSRAAFMVFRNSAKGWLKLK